MAENTKYSWARQSVKIKESIVASHDPYKEWNQDKKGYFLLRVNSNLKQIEVGFVTNKHVVIKEIIGNNAIELYNTIIRHKLLTRLEHAAYLGKELYKAELALRYGKRYVQEAPLFFRNENEVVKLAKKS